MAPLTVCGTEAATPAGLEVGTEIDVVPTAGDLRAHPRGCKVTAAQEDFADGLLAAAWREAGKQLGMRLTPVLETRCYEAGECGVVRVPGLLRMDAAAVGDDACAGDFADVELEELMLGPQATAPWRTVCGCSGSSLYRKSLRVTGLWGDLWPIPPEVPTVVVMAAAKALESMKNSGQVISNNEIGETRFFVPDFGFEEMTLLHGLREPGGVPV